jgi:hypothetical protein
MLKRTQEEAGKTCSSDQPGILGCANRKHSRSRGRAVACWGAHQDVGHVTEKSGRGRDNLLDRRIMYRNDRKLLVGFQVSSR